MTGIDYAAAAVAVRADLMLSHNQIVEHVTTPGTWWTGPERRAIAEEARAARTCHLCADRKAALSPFTVDGHHDGPGEIHPQVVDVIHRATTDPGRLTRRWYDSALAGGALDPERFVEAIAVAVFTNAVDTFVRAVGADPAPLPDPAPGKPSQIRPEGLETDRAWVPRLREGGPGWTAAYGDRTDVAEVERGLSLVPAELEMLNTFARVHYMDFENVTRPHHVEPSRAINRVQTEFVASRVSAFNDCFY